MGLTTLPRELHLAGTVAHVCGSVFGRSPYKERLDPEKVAARMKGLTLTEIVALILESRLELVELYTGQRTRWHASGTDAVDFVESSSFGNLLGLVPEDLRASLRVDLAAAFDACKVEGEPHEVEQGGQVAVREYGALLVARRDE
jgi:hypothetical protein